MFIFGDKGEISTSGDVSILISDLEVKYEGNKTYR